MIRLRLLVIITVTSLLLAAAGLGREVARFGTGADAASGRLQLELTRRVADRSRQLENFAQRIARLPDLVAAADSNRDRLPELFLRLDSSSNTEQNISTTVWVPLGPAGGYRVLAWSEGPAEEITPDFLSRAPATAVLRGAGGLRLVHAIPVVQDGKRVGVAAAETVIGPAISASTFPPIFAMSSSAGQLRAVPIAERVTDPDGIELVIPDRRGAPLLRVNVRHDQMTRARSAHRWRTGLVALSPWVVWTAFVVAAIGHRRRGATLARWLALSVAACLLVAGVAVIAIWMASHAALAAVWVDIIQALTAITIVAILPAGLWWTRLPRAAVARRPVQWALEQLAGGIALAAGLVLMAWLWRGRIDPTSVEKWQFPIQASDIASVAALTGLLLAQIAIAWGVAGVLGALAARWQIKWRRSAGWMSALLWAAPAAAVPFLRSEITGVAGPVVVILSAVAFGLSATSIRHQFRVTSEARRLVFRFGALLIPVLAVYPLASASADRSARELIERDYGPTTLGSRRPEILMTELSQAQKDIDAVLRPHTPLTLEGGDAVTSQAAFAVWTQTTLSRDRVTSEVELYGSDRQLKSRFSLNMPEFGYLYQTGEPVWQGTGCEWAQFAEPQPSSSDSRWMLHAERGLCAPSGEFLGAVVLHLIPDYRALPFVSSANPYYDVLGGRDINRPGSRITELQLVVYGWSLQPLFTSGRIAWPIDAELDRELTRSRIPFWRNRDDASGRTFSIYFQNDRSGVYALGYPAPTALQHVTRLAEAAAALVGVFVLYLALASLVAKFVRHEPTALPKLFQEIRASFYRKLFLFFVLAAVGPVVLFAIAFGAYMTAKLRADVESEAGNVIVVARRVFDELSRAQTRGSQSRLEPSDAMMVWIRQVMDQDVNLYDGSHLTATSQRDLFESGLLPRRTPAMVYRQVVLERRPISVTEDRFGDFKYLVAAMPLLPPYGREAVLSVPLATRQREIEREIDDLTRGVLAGTVVLVLFAAVLGASVAARVSDPVARLTRATRLIAAGRLDERLVADSADELGRLVEDFNTMTETLVAQRAELARANQLKAWAEMSRQVAHEVKNPLTPIQLAAEHLQRVHEDRQRPLGAALDQCVSTILKQVRLLRRIASEFSTFASQPTPRIEPVSVAAVIESVVAAYRAGLPDRITLKVEVPATVAPAMADRTLLARALTNLVENAFQAMPAGGALRIDAYMAGPVVVIEVADTGVGMDTESVRRAFEPYFSTKTGGSGLGLANAKRNIELCGGSVAIASTQGVGTRVTVSLSAASPGGSDIDSSRTR